MVTSFDFIWAFLTSFEKFEKEITKISISVLILLTCMLWAGELLSGIPGEQDHLRWI